MVAVAAEYIGTANEWTVTKEKTRYSGLESRGQIGSARAMMGESRQMRRCKTAGRTRETKREMECSKQRLLTRPRRH